MCAPSLIKCAHAHNHLQLSMAISPFLLHDYILPTFGASICNCNIDQMSPVVLSTNIGQISFALSMLQFPLVQNPFKSAFAKYNPMGHQANQGFHDW